MRWLSALPLPLRHVVAGAVLLGLTGGAAGLIIGLNAYAPTAWFAVPEVGIPAAVVGGLVGLASGVVVRSVQLVRARRPT